MATLDRLAELRGEMKSQGDDDTERKESSRSSSSRPTFSMKGATHKKASPSTSSTTTSADVADALLRRYQQFETHLGTIRSVSDRLATLSDEERAAATPAKRKQIQQQLDSSMKEAKHAAQLAHKELTDAHRENEVYFQTHDRASASSQIRINLEQKAVRDYTTTGRLYQASLKAVEDELRRRTGRDLDVVDPTLSEEKKNELIESGQASQYIQQRLMEPSLLIRDTVNTIEQRHLEITRLEREVQLIADLFRDMAVLVDLQQESIDVIDKKIQSTKRKTEEGEVHVNSASKWQMKSRKCKCLLCFILLAILAVILIPVLLTSFKKA